MALMKRSSDRTVNCALAMIHSCGPIFHSFPKRFKTEKSNFIAAFVAAVVNAAQIPVPPHFWAGLERLPGVPRHRGAPAQQDTRQVSPPYFGSIGAVGLTRAFPDN